jgi:hydrogenase maturation protease
MARILIVGYGNPLRSDDGLGWRAAEALTRSLSLPEVEVVICQQLTPELADNLTRADVVFFIDAARGGQPGDLACDPVTPQPGTIDTHHSSPAGLLALAQQLYGASPRAFVVSMHGECFEHGSALSATVEAALPKLIALVEKMVREMIGR